MNDELEMKFPARKNIVPLKLLFCKFAKKRTILYILRCYLVQNTFVDGCRLFDNSYFYL